LNGLLPGWVRYFKLAKAKKPLASMDEWIRHRIRSYRLKQLKRPFTKAQTLISMGISEHNAWLMAGSGKGYWRLSGTPQLHMALNLAWFKAQGLYNLSEGYASV